MFFFSFRKISLFIYVNFLAPQGSTQDLRSLPRGSKLCCLQWKHRVLTTGLPDNSLQCFFSESQFSSVQSFILVWLCEPMECSMPDLPVYHQLPEFTQTHVHWVGDAIQLSHPLSSPSPLSLVKVKVIQLDSLRPHWVYSPWTSLGQNTGVGSLSLLQGIFSTQVSCIAGGFFTSRATREALYYWSG